MNVNDARITDALNNEGQYIAQLMEMPDSILTKKLNIVRQQMEMAYEKQLTNALETLSIWERQIIEARFMKNDFEDAPATKPAKKKAVKEEEAPVIMDTPGQEVQLEPSSEPVATKSAQLVLFG